VADSDDVVRAHEDVGLAEGDPVVLQRGRAEHDEQGVAVDLELGHLVRVQRVLDRQLVQPDLRLQHAQVLLGRLLEADPDEIALLVRPGGALPELDLADPAAVAVGVGGDHPAQWASLVVFAGLLSGDWPQAPRLAAEREHVQARPLHRGMAAIGAQGKVVPEIGLW